MNEVFEPTRLTTARHRRGLTKKALADLLNVSPRSIADYEAGRSSPPAPALTRISGELDFPAAFFLRPPLDLFPAPKRASDPNTQPASFRSHYALSARDRDSVLAAGLMAVDIAEFLERQFRLPELNLPPLTLDDSVALSPEAAAAGLRRVWGLGLRPISNVVQLLEKNGVRVFWLARELRTVDAFSFWRRRRAYVVLNTAKSGERSRFDACHELGHLVLHADGGYCGRGAEREANRFASAFLLPKETFGRELPLVPALPRLLKLKPKWRASVAAMVKRGSDLGRYSEWQAKQAWIELSRKKWRTGEPGELEHERSRLFDKLDAIYAERGESLASISEKLALPSDDVLELLGFRDRPRRRRHLMVHEGGPHFG